MVKIICQNKSYSGVSASVTFVNGIGETDDPRLITWFREKGYTVENGHMIEDDTETALKDMTVKRLQAFAAEKGIDITGLRSKADILDAITLVLDDEGDDNGTFIDDDESE
jgi:hypothetical protein